MSLPDPSASLLPGTTAFALDLYHILARAEGNLVCSPYSIYTILTKLSVGAAGDSFVQLARCLHTSPSLETMLPAVTALQQGLAMQHLSGKIHLEEANALWPQSGFKLEAQFRQTLATYFSARPTALDFRRDPEAARQEINSWAAEHTAGRIRDLFPAGTIDTLTRLVLANAIYFKGRWANPFDPTRTKNTPFFASPEASHEVAMMTLSADFGYAQMDGFQALELPYTDHALAMCLLVPDAIDGLPDLETRLSLDLLASLHEDLHSTQARVWLPRFQISSSFALQPALRELGASDIFDPQRADFSAMTGDRDLFVSAAQHQAFVEVNEEGTEAAAATGVTMAVRAMLSPPPEFRADHPFVYLIQERQTGLVLFLGRVADPQEPI
jgi:serpin B